MRSHQLLAAIATLAAAPAAHAEGGTASNDEISAQLQGMINSYVQEHIMTPKVNVYEGPVECADDHKIKSGDFLSVHYTAKIDDSSEAGEKGKTFSSSRDRDNGEGKPIKFQVGQGQIVQGLDIGLVGLCQGSKATLVFHPALGYGSQGLEGMVPPDATLNFDVEILNVTDVPPEIPNFFAMIDKNEDGFLVEEEIGEFLKTIGFNDDGKTVPKEFWDEHDANGDKKITWEEFKGPKGEVLTEEEGKDADAAPKTDESSPEKEEPAKEEDTAAAPEKEEPAKEEDTAAAPEKEESTKDEDAATPEKDEL